MHVPRGASILGLLLLLTGTTPLSAQDLRAIGQLRSSGPPTSEDSKKIASRLRALTADFSAEGMTPDNAGALGAAGQFSSDTLKVDNAGRVQVYVTVVDTSAATVATLERHGLDIEIINLDFAIVQGWIPVENLEALAGEPMVVRIRPPDYGISNTGPTNTEGDALHRCDQARLTGVIGTGVKVGVISNGVSGLSTSQAVGRTGGGSGALRREWRRGYRHP